MKQMPGNLILFILLALLLMAANCVADTGTYRIIDYSVTLDSETQWRDCNGLLANLAGNRRLYSLGYGGPRECELPNNWLGRGSKDSQ